MQQLRFAILKMRSKALTVAMLAGSGFPMAADAGEPSDRKADRPKASRETVALQADDSQWKETAAFETPGWLPVSVANSADGKTTVVGGTEGRIIAFDSATRKEKWKADTGGGFAAVAYSADQNAVLVTFKDGVHLLDAESGKIENSFQEPDCHPTVVAAFPDEVFPVDDQRLLKNHKIIFGSARGYFVKTWIGSAMPGSIELSNVQKGNDPVDANAVPLAIDPAGRSVILTGPVHRDTGKNVLWAWVAGNYKEGSPGNRLLEGHQAAVVSAAWSKNGETAVTGDASGRVIVWDAKMMKETQRLELQGRVAALAVSPDGQDIAAVAVGKQADFYLWKTGQSQSDMQPIHVDRSDFSGPIHACLAFSPNGKVLAGSAINMVWLTRTGKLVGKLHFWEQK